MPTLDRDMRRATLLAALFLAASGDAQAQSPQAETSGPPPLVDARETEAPPTPGAWLTRCTSASRATPPACTLEQQLHLEATGQLFLTVAVHIDSPHSPPRLAIQTPLGLHLPPGLVLQVDDHTPATLAIATCDTNGCHASTPLEDPLLADLAAGQTLHLTLHATEVDTIDITIPLAGFPQGLAAIR
jgi:invasion protein IalB